MLSFRELKDLLALQEFLTEYGDMSLLPVMEEETYAFIVGGTLRFSTKAQGGRIIEDDYEIKICVPREYPDKTLSVFEVGGRIPDDGDHHVNPFTGNLCLSAPLRQVVWNRRNPRLSSFAEKFLAPFLVAISCGSFIFGELPHGDAGVYQDYMEFFGVKNGKELLRLFLLMSEKNERRLYEMPCPYEGNDHKHRVKKCNKARYFLMKFKVIKDSLSSEEWVSEAETLAEFLEREKLEGEKN